MPRRVVLGALASGALLPLVPSGSAVADTRWSAATLPLLSPGPIDPEGELGEPLPFGLAGEDAPAVLRSGPFEPGAEDDADPDAGELHALDASVPFTFRRYDFDIRADAGRPYRLSRPFPVEGWGVVDRHGVRAEQRDGRLWDHPVGQAQYGINAVESFRLTNDARYLALARKQALRLIGRAVSHEGAWFYPYPYRMVLHGRYEVYNPPWYSQMAQGQALSLFCDLGEITGERMYREAADRTFASFLVQPRAGRPWGVYVVNNLLWFEEYPSPAAVRGDLTYNGHTFAAWGLWYYWRWTGDERARLMLQGALRTSVDVAHAVRTRQWRSKYCLRHGRDAAGYHSTHITQHLRNVGLTRHPMFAETADAFYYDHPVQGVSGTVRFSAGRHHGYVFDAEGRIAGRRTMTLARAGTAASRERDKVPGRSGIWYQITSGTMAGYRVQETPGVRYQLGEYAALGYRILRRGRVYADRPRSYRIVDASGGMTAVRTTYLRGARLSIDRRAYLNGVQHLRLADGPYAGRWLQASLAGIPVPQ